MYKKTFKRALALLMAAVMLVSAGNAVLAEEYKTGSYEEEASLDKKNANNAAIAKEVRDALDPESTHFACYVYDEQQRITEVIVPSDDGKLISRVTYGDNYTYTLSELELEPYDGEDERNMLIERGEFIPKKKNSINTEVSNKIYEIFEPGEPICGSFEYDDQWRITAVIAERGDEKWISRVTYGDNYTYTQSEFEPYYGDIENNLLEKRKLFIKKKVRTMLQSLVKPWKPWTRTESMQSA